MLRWPRHSWQFPLTISDRATCRSNMKATGLMRTACDPLCDVSCYPHGPDSLLFWLTTNYVAPKTAEAKQFFATPLPYLDATEMNNAPLRDKGNTWSERYFMSCYVATMANEVNNNFTRHCDVRWPESALRGAWEAAIVANTQPQVSHSGKERDFLCRIAEFLPRFQLHLSPYMLLIMVYSFVLPIDALRITWFLDFVHRPVL
jgi:hypothetical protein